jgi:thioredoxin 1
MWWRKLNIDELISEVAKKLELKAEKVSGSLAKITIKLDKDNFNEIIKNNKVVIVDFWAEWCAPCHLYEPVFNKIAEKYKGKAVFGRVNVDENPTIADAYNVLNIPTTIIFVNGEPKEYLVGAIDEETLERYLKVYIS